MRTTDDGIELGKKLLFKNRPLGLGVETDVIGSNSVFTVNENIPASYIHIDAPSNSSNVWMIAVDGDYINNGTSEIGDTVGTVFSDLHHTITRNSDRSVDLKVGWNTNSSNYVGNIELHVLASTRLGDITFNPIHG